MALSPRCPRPSGQRRDPGPSAEFAMLVRCVMLLKIVYVFRATIFALAASILIAAVACQTPPPPASQSAPPAANPGLTIPPPVAAFKTTPLPGTPGKVLNLTGHFAFVANDGNLVLQDANSGTSRVLVPTGTQGYAQYPAFSPDGKQVAYSYSAFTKDGQVQSQIRVINLDGSNDHVVVSPQDLKLAVDLAAWSPDGKNLYVTQISPVPPSSQKADIYRVSVNGGNMTKVIDNGFEASLSPDGKKMVFQRVDFSTYAASLWIADVDGSNARQLADSTSFTAMFGMRFSPESQSIVFAVSGPPKKQLPGLQASLFHGRDMALEAASPNESCLVSFLFTCWVGKAEAHGLPWDLYIVNPDGTKFERLTQIGADSPVPVWSKDGKYIAFFEGTGIYMLDREKNAIYAITHIGGYGGFDWR
jgi:Tol biopolymer transport system component